MIRQYEPLIGDAERTAVNEYMKDPGFLTEYKKTAEFEQKIAEYLDVNHCIVVNNGTISLCLALMALGIKPGDKVIVPNLTMIASVNAVRFIGAVPILVDVDDRLLLDLDRVKQLVILDQTIKAVMFVSLNGRHFLDADFPKWCKEYNVALLDDAAQAFGSCDISGKKIAGQCDIASFSFSMPKIITTGQGGCLTTNDDNIAQTLRRLKDFGRDCGGNDNHQEFGINSKFTELQAIIGLAQLQSIESRVKAKKYIYNRYCTNLKGVKGIKFVRTDLQITTPWFMDVFVQERDKLIEELKKRGIGSRAIYPPLCTQGTCKDIKSYAPDKTYKISGKFADEGMWLPSSFTLNGEIIDSVCNNIKEILNG